MRLTHGVVRPRTSDFRVLNWDTLSAPSSIPGGSFPPVQSSTARLVGYKHRFVFSIKQYQVKMVISTSFFDMNAGRIPIWSVRTGWPVKAGWPVRAECRCYAA